MKKNALSGRPLLIRDFLNAVKESPYYVAINKGGRINVYRGSDPKEASQFPPVFTIKGGPVSNAPVHALFSRGERKKISHRLSSILPALVK